MSGGSGVCVDVGSGIEEAVLADGFGVKVVELDSAVWLVQAARTTIKGIETLESPTLIRSL